MANIIDYITWRGDIPFEVSPFCEVDNLIFSSLSYIDYGQVLQPYLLGSPRRLDCVYEELSGTPGFDVSTNAHSLLRAAAVSKRFSCVYMAYGKVVFNKEETVQFGAVTFILPDNSLFVAYRGTDNTLVGFKEDFNMSFSRQIPSQALAVEYLKDVASVFKGSIRIGGHSKGGHLAEYAAAFSSATVQDRITAIYSNDGPGFIKETLESGNFAAVSSKLHIIVPQSSIIGMLLEHSADYTIIESTERGGLAQHDPYTWKVMGPSLVHLKELTPTGKRYEDVMKKWLSSVNPEEKERFINSMFDILESTGASSLSDLSKDSFNRLITAVKTYGTLDQDSKTNIVNSLKRFAEAFIR